MATVFIVVYDNLQDHTPLEDMFEDAEMFTAESHARTHLQNTMDRLNAELDKEAEFGVRWDWVDVEQMVIHLGDLARYSMQMATYNKPKAAGKAKRGA